MRVYETIFIVKSDLSDEALADRVAWVTDILTRNGAEVINVEQWGKKRLAYQVNRQRYGIYVMVHYEGEPQVVPELERNFKLSEEILKYLTVRLEAPQVEKVRAAASKAAERAEEQSGREAESEAGVEPDSAHEVAAETDSEVPTETGEGKPIQPPREEEE